MSHSPPSPRTHGTQLLLSSDMHMSVLPVAEAQEAGEVPELPLEILLKIVDLLCDDVQALSACALVCKLWLSCSRCHMFGTVDLHPGNIVGFLKLFRISSQNYISPYIRHFKYDYESGPSPDFRFFLPAHGSRPAQRVQRSFTEILHRMPSLPAATTLSLQGVQLELEPPYISTIFPNLTDFSSAGHHLKLSGLRVQENVALSRLCQYAMDERLTAAEIVSMFGEAASIHWSHIPTTLTSLSLWTGGIYMLRILYMWLSSHPHPPKIRNLDIHCHDGRDLKACLALIQHFWVGLEVLSLYHDVGDKWLPKGLEDDFADSDRYERISNLKFLQVCPALGTGRTAKLWLWNFLSGLEKCPLQTLALGVDVGCFAVELGNTLQSVINDMEWEDLFRVLRLPHLRKLNMLSLLVRDHNLNRNDSEKESEDQSAARTQAIEYTIREKFQKQPFHFTLSFGEQPAAPRYHPNYSG